jgi:hypothetical protein
MARIRSVHPGLASDEAYMSMSMAAKAAWPVLWTECDDHGIFEWKPIVLKARIFPADNVDFADLLAEWERLGCVKRKEIDGKAFGLIRNFCKFQRPKNPSYRFPLPEDERDFIALKDDTTEVLHQSSGSPPEIPPQMKDEGGKREEVDKKESRAVAPRRAAVEEAFEEFWKVYPKRKGANPKAPARKLFDAAVKSGADPKAIIAGAKRCAEQDHDKINTEFIPQAVKWLRDRRWEDYGGEVINFSPTIGFYAAFDSQQMVAWEQFERQNGKSHPRDRNGGWTFPSEWPPGFEPAEATA